MCFQFNLILIKDYGFIIFTFKPAISYIAIYSPEVTEPRFIVAHITVTLILLHKYKPSLKNKQAQIAASRIAL